MGRLASRLPRYPFGSPGIDDAIELEDNEKIIFGTGSDCEVYFDGTNFQMKIDGTLKISEKSSGIDFARFNSATRQVDLGQDVAGKESVLIIHGIDAAGLEIRAGDTSTDAVKIYHNDVAGYITTTVGDLYLNPAGAWILPQGGINLAGQMLRQAVVHTALQATEGALAWAAVNHKLLIYNGTAWETVTSA